MFNEGVLLHEITKGTNCLLNILFSHAVAEHITFDAYVGIAVHGFLLAASSSSCLSFIYYMK